MKMPRGKPKLTITELLMQAIDGHLFNLANSNDCTLIDIKELKENNRYFEIIDSLIIDLQHRTENALIQLKYKALKEIKDKAHD